MMGFRRDEDIKQRRIDRAVMRRVVTYVRPYLRPLIAFVVAVILGSIATALAPLLLKELIDKAIPPAHHNRHLVMLVALGAVGLALFNAVLSLAQRYYSARIGEGLIYDLRVKLFDHVQSMPIAFFTRTQTGSLQSRLNNDVVGAQQAVTNTLGTVLQNVISLIVTLVIMFRLSAPITLLTLLALPAFILPARMLGPRIQKLARTGMQENAAMNNITAERFNVAGAMLAKLFGRPDRERDGFAARAGSVRDVGIATAIYSRILLVALGLVTAVGTAIVYWIGGNLAVSGTISAGDLAAFAAYVALIYQPLAQLTNSRVDVLTALVSFERVFEVIDFPAAITDAPDAVDLVQPKGRIQLDHVWFRHPPGREVSLESLEAPGTPGADEPSDWTLRDVSLVIDPGDTIALVGASGAGKTTIAMLVPRVYEAVQGSVSIDGHDVRDLTLASVHAAIGLVPQDPHLFHDTIRANLRFARPEATDADLRQALEGARIWDLVASLPDGLDTVVGERGYRMSGGEKQRLAIARLLLKNPAIVILDEATSHLDSESEVAIQRAFDEALRGRTAIVIAHRLSTIVDADRIVVVDAGRIVESGTHSELLARAGVYAELYRTQLGRSEGDEKSA
ncbi:MAG: ATP-binding cassette, subfamily bacterial [Actinomycetota bacterium]|nr:ATP-binding cassette, subfamily bacterial [Actinomycetota bacterium]MDQ1476319.1 ATP-binding cassette, subfamily bacterial [Actinomycetota bacterium]